MGWPSSGGKPTQLLTLRFFDMKILMLVVMVWLALVVLGWLFSFIKLALWIGAIALVIVAVQRLLQGRNVLTGERG